MVVAFDAGNLKPVAVALRKQYPEVTILVCGDDDIRSDEKPNIGRDAATAAAKAVGGLVAIPEMNGEKCDFNDLHVQRGPEAVKTTIELALRRDPMPTAEIKEDRDATDSAGWPEPLPLVTQLEPEAYPLDVLPEMIRRAVEEVQAFTKAPVPMVAASALASLALAGQAHCDVKRADKLTGPTGLFFLTIADSGERKSTCDGFFSTPIKAYDQAQAENAKPELKRQAAAFAAWAAERDGVLAAIKQAAKSGKSVDTLHGTLTKMEERKPVSLRVPKLMRGDDTPENLAYVLARGWPSAGVLTAEAGLVFGSHGMSTDSVMRNLALLNTLWDGGTHHVGRRTSESFTVRGARLTMGLQIQEATLRSFFDRSGDLARGTGFLARFLVSWPESTQGFRPFTEPPTAWPALDAFHRRLTDILEKPVAVDLDGALTPTVLSMTPEAKRTWIAFHDEIEEKLRSGGELYDVRDVASKIADNAARVAALFQVFCSKCSSSNEAVPEIELSRIQSASIIAAWHLNESRRFFGELALPSSMTHPAKLEAWLLEYCHRKTITKVPLREVQQFGPSRLREKAPLIAAVRELNALHRARLVGHIITVNPSLLVGGGA